MSDFGVLLSCAGRRVGLMAAFRDSLRGLGLDGRVIATDVSRGSAAFQLADRAHLVPRCTDPAFVPEMLRIAEAEGVRLIVPTIDTELPIWAAERERFAEAGVHVAVSSAKTVAISGDKAETHDWLVSQRLPTVEQLPGTAAVGLPGAWKFPLVVKPRRGSAGKGVSVVHDREALRFAARADDVVIQTRAPGREHTVDAYVDRRGRCLATVPRLRLEVRGGEVSKARTVRHAALEQLVHGLCERLPGARGVLNVQVFVDEETSTLRVIEINARFGGGFPLTHRAGAPFTTWMIREVLGETLAADPPAWRAGVTMLRYDEAVFLEETHV